MVCGQFVILFVSLHTIRVHWTHEAKRAELLRDSSVLLYRYEARISGAGCLLLADTVVVCQSLVVVVGGLFVMFSRLCV